MGAGGAQPEVEAEAGVLEQGKWLMATGLLETIGEWDR